MKAELVELEVEAAVDGVVFSPVKEGVYFFVPEDWVRNFLLASDRGEFWPYEAHLYTERSKVVFNENGFVAMEFVRQSDLRLW